MEESQKGLGASTLGQVRMGFICRGVVQPANMTRIFGASVQYRE